MELYPSTAACNEVYFGADKLWICNDHYGCHGKDIYPNDAVVGRNGSGTCHVVRTGIDSYFGRGFSGQCFSHFTFRKSLYVMEI